MTARMANAKAKTPRNGPAWVMMSLLVPLVLVTMKTSVVPGAFGPGVSPDGGGGAGGSGGGVGGAGGGVGVDI